MLSENIIAYDILENEKHSVKDLTNAILETKNQNLKQLLMQMKEQALQSQKELFEITEQNGWYLPAENADTQHISRFNNFFSQKFMAESQQQTAQTQTQAKTQTQNQNQPAYSYYQNQGTRPEQNPGHYKSVNNQDPSNVQSRENNRNRQQGQSQYGGNYGTS